MTTMINKDKIRDILLIGVVAGLVVLGVQFIANKSQSSHSLGAVGGLLIENYDPYVMANGGINSALPFQTSSTLTVAGIINSGASTSTAQANFTGGIRVGSNGFVMSEINDGLCYIFPYAALIPASTTKIADCQANPSAGTAGAIQPIPGIQANDSVVATLSTTTASTIFGGLKIVGVGASTTAGYITLYIQNGTGVDFTWPTTGNASGTAYFHSSNR